MQKYLILLVIPVFVQLSSNPCILSHSKGVKTLNLGDISQIKIEDIPDHDLFTYSFPCTNISVAGKQEGLDKGSGTSSSLLWDCQRIIEAKRPKYLLLENVKNLVGKKHKPNFDKWLEWLESKGYENHWEVLNAKDYGIPQNRERVFVVSILDGKNEEGYSFPKKKRLDKSLKDVLDEQVDEKYYLSQEKTNQLTITNPELIKEINTGETNSNSIERRCSAIRGRYDETKGRKIEQKLELRNIGKEKEVVSNTLTSVQKDNMIIEVE